MSRLEQSSSKEARVAQEDVCQLTVAMVGEKMQGVPLFTAAVA